MATRTVSSKAQIVIPRHLREKHRLTSGVRLQITETDEGLVLSRQARSNFSRLAITSRIGKGDGRVAAAPRRAPM